jgi:hypothetical protein
MKLYGVTSPDDTLTTTNAGVALNFFFSEIDRLRLAARRDGSNPTIVAPWRDEVDRITYDPPGTRYTATVGEATIVLEVLSE